MSVRHETYKMKIISEDIEEAEPVRNTLDIHSAVKDVKPEVQSRIIVVNDQHETQSTISSKTKTSKTSSKSAMRLAFLKKLSKYSDVSKKTILLENEVVEKEVEPEVKPVPLERPQTHEIGEELKMKIQQWRDDIVLNDKIKMKNQAKVDQLMKNLEKEFGGKSKGVKEQYLKAIQGNQDLTFDFEGNPILQKKAQIVQTNENRVFKLNSQISEGVTVKQSTQYEMLVQKARIHLNNKSQYLTKSEQVYSLDEQPQKTTKDKSDSLISQHMVKHSVSNLNQFQYAMLSKNVKPTKGVIIRENGKVFKGPETEDVTLQLQEQQDLRGKQQKKNDSVSGKVQNQYSKRNILSHKSHYNDSSYEINIESSQRSINNCLYSGHRIISRNNCNQNYSMLTSQSLYNNLTLDDLHPYRVDSEQQQNISMMELSNSEYYPSQNLSQLRTYEDSSSNVQLPQIIVPSNNQDKQNQLQSLNLFKLKRVKRHRSRESITNSVRSKEVFTVRNKSLADTNNSIQQQQQQYSRYDEYKEEPTERLKRISMKTKKMNVLLLKNKQ